MREYKVIKELNGIKKGAILTTQGRKYIRGGRNIFTADGDSLKGNSGFVDLDEAFLDSHPASFKLIEEKSNQLD